MKSRKSGRSLRQVGSQLISAPRASALAQKTDTRTCRPPSPRPSPSFSPGVHQATCQTVAWGQDRLHQLEQEGRNNSPLGRSQTSRQHLTTHSSRSLREISGSLARNPSLSRSSTLSQELTAPGYQLERDLPQGLLTTTGWEPCTPPIAPLTRRRCSSWSSGDDNKQNRQPHQRRSTHIRQRIEDRLNCWHLKQNLSHRHKNDLNLIGGVRRCLKFSQRKLCNQQGATKMRSRQLLRKSSWTHREQKYQNINLSFCTDIFQAAWARHGTSDKRAGFYESTHSSPLSKYQRHKIRGYEIGAIKFKRGRSYHKTIDVIFSPCLLRVRNNQRLPFHNFGHDVHEFWHAKTAAYNGIPQRWLRSHPVRILCPPP